MIKEWARKFIEEITTHPHLLPGDNMDYYDRKRFEVPAEYDPISGTSVLSNVSFGPSGSIYVDPDDVFEIKDREYSQHLRDAHMGGVSYKILRCKYCGRMNDLQETKECLGCGAPI